MARQISRAEAWEKTHEIFTQVNFNSFDFTTIKNSLIDYTKLYFPEDFNDYIESSEFIAILELFAYVGELLAYRIDLNAHENFITQAERKDSILRLAKLISYQSSRNVAARGLVKINSISTTEVVLDSQGRNLANRVILWNDANNTDWKEQFLLVMNKVLEQNFGTVLPSERVQVDDVLFELYTWNNQPLGGTGISVFSYSAADQTQSFPMELVPVKLDDTGPSEKRPERNLKFSILYGSDGLGDGSNTTGFFLFTKQGTMNLDTKNFDGITPNQTFDINEDNINETDLWLNNVSPDNREVLIDDPNKVLLPHLVAQDMRYGEWINLDLANAQNIMFNTNKNRHKYETETRDSDQVTLIFGDGEFSDIPSGAFDVWYRVSANSDSAISSNAVVEDSSSFSYIDEINNQQTFAFTYSLINSLQNSSKSEDLEHVRRVAPSVYYTQDRMVNGRDYNSYMLQDPSILRLRAINRTYAGESQYIAWHDPSTYYENVKIFGDDLALYWFTEDTNNGGSFAATPASVSSLLTNYIEPLLCSTDIFTILAPKFEERGLNPATIRCEFSSKPYSFDENSNEILAITEALENAEINSTKVELYYSVVYDEWTVATGVYNHPCDQETCTFPCNVPPNIPNIPGCDRGAAESIYLISAIQPSSTSDEWKINWATNRLIAQSQSTKFWNTNTTVKVLNYDTLNPNLDKIVVLQANKSASGGELLDSNEPFNVLSQELVEQNLPNAGLPDIHKLSIMPEDTNDDGIPDNLSQTQLFNAVFEHTYAWYIAEGLVDVSNGTPMITIPNNMSYVVSEFETDLSVSVINSIGEILLYTVTLSPNEDAAELIVRHQFSFQIGTTIDMTDTVRIVLQRYVYLKRESLNDAWVPVLPTDSVKTAWALETTTVVDNKRIDRASGRYPLNFAWFHTSPRLNLIDPAASNIIDIFVITRSYYLALTDWLSGNVSIEPVSPTPIDLRTTYSSLLQNKMISDTIILYSGKIKLLFGSKAVPELQSVFKVIRPQNTSLVDNDVKVRMVAIIRKFFDLADWEFGETFYYTELAASIHAELGPEIDSVVLVPLYAQSQFGDMFQVQSREDEMFLPDINTINIEIVNSYTADNIRQNENS